MKSSKLKWLAGLSSLMLCLMVTLVLVLQPQETQAEVTSDNWRTYYLTCSDPAGNISTGIWCEPSQNTSCISAPCGGGEQ